MTVTKEQIIEQIRQHAKFGCDEMETQVCDHLLGEIDTLFELDSISTKLPTCGNSLCNDSTHWQEASKEIKQLEDSCRAWYQLGLKDGRKEVIDELQIHLSAYGNSKITLNDFIVKLMILAQNDINYTKKEKTK